MWVGYNIALLMMWEAISGLHNLKASHTHPFTVAEEQQWYRQSERLSFSRLIYSMIYGVVPRVWSVLYTAGGGNPLAAMTESACLT